MTGKPSILDQILARKRMEVAERARREPQERLRECVLEMPPCRPFRAALEKRLARGLPAVIAEIKQVSPSTGRMRREFDPAALARAYENGGATCLSVLTDRDFFQGDAADLAAARAACALPVLRKDFIIDPWQVLESRAMGADAVLLIVAALEDAALMELSALGRRLGMDVLVEVHDAGELDRALAVPGELVGVNNRDLHRFETRLETSLELAPRVARDRLVVAESGIRTKEDIDRLRAGGIHAFLIGESLMRAADPGDALKRLLGED